MSEREPGLAVGCLLIAAVLAACGGGGDGASATEARAAEPETAEAEAVAVAVDAVRIGPVSALYSTSTTLRADREATVIARARGVVRRLQVEEGDRVREGQVLVILEDDEQRIEHDRTRANLDVEQQEYDRAGRLYHEKLLSDEDFETARRELEEARHAFARAALELDRTRIRSPFRGQVLRRHLDTGATVADSTPVYDVADLDPLYADVNIPERHVSRLAVGQRVRLTADAPGSVHDARIERIAPLVDPATGTVKVTLAVVDSTGLRPGAFVRADIVTETRHEALLVPRAALVAEGRRWHVFRLRDDGGHVEQIEVTLGFEEGDRVQIAEVVGASELGPADRVVVLGAPALTDGAAVRVVEPGAETSTEPESEPA